MKKHLAPLLLMTAFLSTFGFSARAVQAGDAAPAFEAPATGGKTVKLADYKDKWLVLYFYPKADTPGCTKQACSLRDGIEGLTSVNATVLGASVDSVESQEKFKAKYKLPFDLIADEKKEVAKAYDVMGALGLMAQRKTFIINPEGKVARVSDDVETSKHVEQVAAALKELQKKD